MKFEIDWSEYDDANHWTVTVSTTQGIREWSTTRRMVRKGEEAEVIGTMVLELKELVG